MLSSSKWDEASSCFGADGDGLIAGALLIILARDKLVTLSFGVNPYHVGFVEI